MITRLPIKFGNEDRFIQDVYWSYGKNFENASVQLMSFENPLFEEMLKDLAPRPNCP
jgi:hypothetical protein